MLLSNLTKLKFNLDQKLACFEIFVEKQRLDVMNVAQNENCGN